MERLTLLLFVFVAGCGQSTPTEDVISDTASLPDEEQREVAAAHSNAEEQVSLTNRGLKPLSAYPDALSVAELEAKYFTKFGSYDRVRVRGVIRGLYTEKNGSKYEVYLRLYSTSEKQELTGSILDQAPHAYQVSSLADLAGLRPEQEIVIEGKPEMLVMKDCNVLAVGSAEGLPTLPPLMSEADHDRMQLLADQLESIPKAFVSNSWEVPFPEITVHPNDSGEISSNALDKLRDPLSRHLTLQNATQAMVDMLPSVPTITHLEIDDDFENLDLAVLRKLPHLYWVKLSGAGLTDQHIADLCQAPGLRCVYLSFWDSGATDKSIKSLSTCKYLRWLRLGGQIRLSDQGLGDLSKCSNLLKLEVPRSRLSGSCFKELATLQQLHSLRLVGGSDNGGPVDDQLLSAIGEHDWPALATLSIIVDSISTAGIEGLLGSPLRQLQSLQLGTSDLNEGAIAAIVAKPPPKLKTLNLGKTVASKEAVLSLVKIQTLRTVEMRELGGDIKAMLDEKLEARD